MHVVSFGSANVNLERKCLFYHETPITSSYKWQFLFSHFSTFFLQNKRKKDFDIKVFGFMSVIELMGSLPDLVRIERPVANGDWLLFCVQEGIIVFLLY